MSEVITAVYEISVEVPAGRAAQVAVEITSCRPNSPPATQSVIRWPTFARFSSGRAAALATVDYPVDLAGAELGQLLVLLLGNVSLQDGVRLVDVALPARLAAALPGPRLGIAGVRALVGEPDRALLATALKPVGMTPQQLADLAYDIAAGGLHILKEDQGLANQTWRPSPNGCRGWPRRCTGPTRTPAAAASTCRASTARPPGSPSRSVSHGGRGRTASWCCPASRVSAPSPVRPRSSTGAWCSRTPRSWAASRPRRATASRRM